LVYGEGRDDVPVSSGPGQPTHIPGQVAKRFGEAGEVKDDEDDTGISPDYSYE
jgi:hypothetical protein